MVPKVAVGETSIHAPFSRGVEPFASATSMSAAAGDFARKASTPCLVLAMRYFAEGRLPKAY